MGKACRIYWIYSASSIEKFLGSAHYLPDRSKQRSNRMLVVKADGREEREERPRNHCHTVLGNWIYILRLGDSLTQQSEGR